MERLASLLTPYPDVYKLKHVANDNPPMTNDQHIEYLWSALINNKF